MFYTADAMTYEAIRYFVASQIPTIIDKILDSAHEVLGALCTIEDLAKSPSRAPKQSSSANVAFQRPITLVCCDAKVFTRLSNTRLMSDFGKLLTPSQSPFMPRRFIGEPAMILQCSQALATATQSTTPIALLLDQVKVHDDRVSLG
ncbi:hypothetical protein HMPREF1544_06038 [Mucor circinelloides 1006PhL]|uniref:Uncharacterized protein n=1 Tax=Mucor circinelloides f. circinelloides (strain 1006PhL) TaxID=1220926 RepID=S2JWN6_MUCC1|nr:hypothetical protein HMPREF1544_06038 [Mucor circinelloides 1006PhL]